MMMMMMVVVVVVVMVVRVIAGTDTVTEPVCRVQRDLSER